MIMVDTSKKVILLVLSTTRHNPNTINVAIEEAKARGARLHILFILDSAMANDIYARLTDLGFIGEKPSHQISDAILGEYRMRGEAKIREVEEKAKSAGIETGSSLSEGDFVAICLSEINTLRTDLVILSRKKRSNLSRFLFGSSVDKLKRSATCEIRVIDEAE